MQHLLRVAIVWLLLCGAAAAQSVPPIQTINTNQGIGCTGVGSQGAVSFCKPGWTYGCNPNQASTQILNTDGNRTSIQFQDTGSIPIVLCFGDACTPFNGFVVQPGNSYLWSNMSQGNTPGRVSTTSISIMSNGASTCTFLFTE